MVPRSGSACSGSSATAAVIRYGDIELDWGSRVETRMHLNPLPGVFGTTRYWMLGFFRLSTVACWASGAHAGFGAATLGRC